MSLEKDLLFITSFTLYFAPPKALLPQNWGEPKRLLSCFGLSWSVSMSETRKSCFLDPLPTQEHFKVFLQTTPPRQMAKYPLLILKNSWSNSWSQVVTSSDLGQRDLDLNLTRTKMVSIICQSIKNKIPCIIVHGVYRAFGINGAQWGLGVLKYTEHILHALPLLSNLYNNFVRQISVVLQICKP